MQLIGSTAPDQPILRLISCLSELKKLNYRVLWTLSVDYFVEDNTYSQALLYEE